MNFRLFKVKINISFFFALSLAFVLSRKNAETITVLMFSAFFHELAHLFAIIYFKELPKKIIVGIFGIEIRRAGNVRLSYTQECIVSLAGPLMNLFLAAVFFVLSSFAGSVNPLSPALINLSLAALNLLPIMPLDGGRFFYFLLCAKRSEQEALKIAEKAALITLFPLSVLGFTVLIRSGYNFTLLAVCVYLSFLFVMQKKVDLYQ